MSPRQKGHAAVRHGYLARFFPSLPDYTGAYPVGCRDVLYTPAATTAAATTATGEDKVVSPFLVRLYYPADEGGGERRPHWLPLPSSLYSTGYGGFLRIPWYISRPAFAMTLGSTKLPARMEAPIAAAAQEGAGAFPLILFSHGLGGCRNTYSAICGELASHGFIVAALEHRDGSAAMSCLEKGKDPIPYRHIAPGEDDVEVRQRQVAQRVREVGAAWELLRDIGDGEEGGGIVGWKDRVDMERVIMAGHSFGAATTILSLATYPGRFLGGIALDTWMLPLRPTPPKPLHPILSVNSSAFTEWEENYVPLEAYITTAPSPSTLVTVHRTSHQNQSDFPLLFHWAMRHMKKNALLVSPEAAIRSNAQQCLAFLHQVLSPLPGGFAGVLWSTESPEEDPGVMVYDMEEVRQRTHGTVQTIPPPTEADHEEDASRTL